MLQRIRHAFTNDNYDGKLFGTVQYDEVYIANNYILTV